MFIKAHKSLLVRLPLVLILIMGVLGMKPVQPVLAGTITVTNINTSQPPVRYVKWDATGTHTGTSWTNAFADLQSALAAASSGDEIWVAAGTYKPTTGTDRTISFALKNGVGIYGGFAGGETLRSQRNPIANITILSGDIGVVGDSSDNSYHVIYNENISNTAVLDGFTIRGGNANSYDEPHDRGGGMYNFQSHPTLSNLIFRNHYAEDFGGGMYNDNSNVTLTEVTFSYNVSNFLGGGMYNEAFSSPTLTNVTFLVNDANSAGGGMANLGTGIPVLTNVMFLSNTSVDGGGMLNAYGSNPVLNKVTFESNSVSESGGGMRNSSSAPILTDVIFSNNGALNGGAMANSKSSPLLTNVTFVENSAYSEGGGLQNLEGSNPVLTNVTFSANTAMGGAGILNASSNPVLKNVTFSGNQASYAGGAIANAASSNPILTNVILWGDTSTNGPEIYNSSSTATITYSIVQGGYAGTGNLAVNPLLGPLQDNGGFTQTMILGAGSPAVDAGNDTACPSTDQRGMPRPQGSHCDIGAYEKGGSFWDVPTQYWSWSYIERLYTAGITGGCATNPLMYCPGAVVTRDQMAVFLLKGKHGSGYVPPAAMGMFADVPTNYWAAAWIEQLAKEGITSGCSVTPQASWYCPGTPVTRDQMAVFLLKAKHAPGYVPPSATGVFVDVPQTYWAAAWIEALAEEGVTAGCGNNNYCPSTPVTRDQMAVFLVRNFNLP